MASSTPKPQGSGCIVWNAEVLTSSKKSTSGSLISNQGQWPRNFGSQTLDNKTKTTNWMSNSAVHGSSWVDRSPKRSYSDNDDSNSSVSQSSTSPPSPRPLDFRTAANNGRQNNPFNDTRSSSNCWNSWKSAGPSWCAGGKVNLSGGFTSPRSASNSSSSQSSWNSSGGSGWKTSSRNTGGGSLQWNCSPADLNCFSVECCSKPGYCQHAGRNYWDNSIKTGDSSQYTPPFFSHKNLPTYTGYQSLKKNKRMNSNNWRKSTSTWDNVRRFSGIDLGGMTRVSVMKEMAELGLVKDTPVDLSKRVNT